SAPSHWTRVGSRWWLTRCTDQGCRRALGCLPHAVRSMLLAAVASLAWNWRAQSSCEDEADTLPMLIANNGAKEDYIPVDTEDLEGAASVEEATLQSVSFLSNAGIRAAAAAALGARAPGGARKLMVHPRNLAVRVRDDAEGVGDKLSLCVSFFLPAGAYATV